MNRFRGLSGVSVLLGSLALVLAILTAAVSFSAMDRKPVLTVQPQQPRYLAGLLMDSICEGNFENAAKVLQGRPQLGTDREPADEVGKLFWDAYLESLSYEFVGDCYATEDGLSLDAKISYMDFTAVMENLRENTGKLLTKRVRQAQDPSEIYDENNNYRQELVNQVLLEAAQEALRDQGKMVTEDLTVRMVHDGEQWWVMPDPALIHLLSGGSLDRG